MNEQSWNTIKKRVYERADGCCEYCQTSQKNTGQSMHVEHIDPSGGDELSNLCLSCANCNLSKGKVTSAIDPETNEVVALFNPRTQCWSEHFTWLGKGERLQGLTSIGRATIQRMKINQERVVHARVRWLAGGFHPPSTI